MKNFEKAGGILLTVLLSLFFSTSVSAQDGINNSAKDWTVYNEYSGVIVYYKDAELHDEHNGLHEEYRLLKIVNTTGQKISIEWYLELYYDGNKTSEQSPEFFYSTNLSPSQSVEGDVNKGSMLRVYKKSLTYDDMPKLTGFELINVKTLIK